MSDVVEVSRTWYGYRARAKFPDGLTIEWGDDGTGEALVRAEADMRGLDIHDPEGLLEATATDPRDLLAERVLIAGLDSEAIHAYTRPDVRQLAALLRDETASRALLDALNAVPREVCEAKASWYGRYVDEALAREHAEAQRDADAEPSWGAQRIGAERQRQITAEGYTPEHDQHHSPMELMNAAVAYLNAARRASTGVDPTMFAVPTMWPWESEAWKPSVVAERNLEKAGALTAAAIDRCVADAEATQRCPRCHGQIHQNRRWGMGGEVCEDCEVEGDGR